MSKLRWMFILLFVVNGFFVVCATTAKRFVFVIPSFNNALWCQRNLQSILQQKYDNFVGIYIDDCSTDRTKQIVLDELGKTDVCHKIRIKANTKRVLKAKNIWLVVHGLYDNAVKINDEDVVIVCDGDDWYAVDYLLSFLDVVYRTEAVWLTYGGYQTFPPSDYGTGDSSLTVPALIKAGNLYRKSYGYSSQTRSFYAWLYRQIKLEDFFYKGRFVPMASDAAKMIPMMEMAGGRFKRIMQPLYIYNRSNQINDDKVNNVLQHDIDHSIRARPCYTPLARLVSTVISSSTIDMVILVADNTFSAEKLGEMRCRMSGIGKIYLIGKCAVSNASNLPNDCFYVSSSKCGLKESLQRTLKQMTADFVLVANGFKVPANKLDLQKVALFMHTTKAFSFNLILPQEEVPAIYEELAFGVSAWQNVVADMLVKKYAFDMQVYNKNDLIELFKSFDFCKVKDLTDCWRRSTVVNNQYKVNLFFDTKK